MVCYYILWKELGMTLTVEEFMYMYRLKKDPTGGFKTSGWQPAFQGGHPIQPNMTTERMKKKLSEMRRSGSGEKRRNNEPEGSQSLGFPFESSTQPSDTQTSASISLPCQLSSFINHTRKILHLGALKEENAKATQEHDIVKSLIDETVETEDAHQLNACLGQIEQKYLDLDLSRVYEVEALSGGADTRDTPVGDIGGGKDPTA
ncbi:hypothetical protein FNV43_RR07298 [Rhamnella rubrinervis]|uniref:Uncharacterized protein n=1 Tax=Rhamnella rubrinervis TaxID=2594499 RepID=A0A8K0MMU2_9ROSA|nr:hypothetical protein FNV43_RR07298 [Rhamnella rubrinervis]